MNSGLTGAQRRVIRALVGDAIAREDLPALEGAYRDFRAGMDSLKATFEQQTRASERVVFGDQAASASQDSTPQAEAKP
ncbi:hypothetical protein ACFVTM_09350 [Arthrobacter sp. NPDC058130]|uniref:hypothetical protein n=1 Tax=Arthrobacter sp. NPDC058130 TaxID=3346353 RepID=UPI0036EB0E30